VMNVTALIDPYVAAIAAASAAPSRAAAGERGHREQRAARDPARRAPGDRPQPRARELHAAVEADRESR